MVSPYFNGTRDASYDLQEQLGVKIAGDQKLTPFPHWTVSTQTANKRFAHLSVPVSDWYVDSEIGQSTEAGHNSGTIHALVDSFYAQGALINLYSHSSADELAPPGVLVQDYIRYAMGKPRLWSTNELGVYKWWLKRSATQIVPTFIATSNLSRALFTISGATDPQTAVEAVLPTNHLSFFAGIDEWSSSLRPACIATNGANYSSARRHHGDNVEIQYLLAPLAQPDLFAASSGGSLIIPAPGVLATIHRARART